MSSYFLFLFSKITPSGPFMSFLIIIFFLALAAANHLSNHLLLFFPHTTKLGQGFLRCSSIFTAFRPHQKNQYITGSKMNRPNTEANTSIAFLTLLLTHYLTKGAPTNFLDYY